MIASNPADNPRRIACENFATPEEVPRVGLVPIRGPGGQVLDAYRGVEREDNHEIVSVVSSRYGLVGHREVALAALEREGRAMRRTDEAGVERWEEPGLRGKACGRSHEAGSQGVLPFYSRDDLATQRWNLVT